MVALASCEMLVFSTVLLKYRSVMSHTQVSDESADKVNAPVLVPVPGPVTRPRHPSL
jgi:hypothetical protein